MGSEMCIRDSTHTHASTALKSALGTYYYTHGMVESLRNVAGTEFHRTIDESGQHAREVLHSQGPLTERITVEVCGMIEIRLQDSVVCT